MISGVPLFTLAAILIIMLGNIKRRKIFNAFRILSATSPDCAKNLIELGINNSILFGSQVRQKVIVSLPGGNYYLDEDRLIQVMSFRRKIVLVLALGLLILVFVLFRNS